MAILANVVFKNIKLVDAYVKIKRTYEQDGKWFALVGVAQSKAQSARGSYLFDFIVGPSDINDMHLMYLLVNNYFDTESVTYTNDEEPLIAPADEVQLERISELVKDVVLDEPKPKKKPRKKATV